MEGIPSELRSIAEWVAKMQALQTGTQSLNDCELFLTKLSLAIIRMNFHIKGCIWNFANNFHKDCCDQYLTEKSKWPSKEELNLKAREIWENALPKGKPSREHPQGKPLIHKGDFMHINVAFSNVVIYYAYFNVAISNVSDVV
jgi:hypothetical protein